MATRAELEAALQNPNARKFLDLLSYTEGTQKNGYATAFGGGRIDDLSKHPRTSSGFTQTDGKKNTTTAAGRYQFLSRTWDEQAKKLGLSDFGAKSQDLAALSLAADSGALKSILSGDFKTAINKTGGKWASLPSSPHPQGKKSWDAVNKFLGSNYAPSQITQELVQPTADTLYKTEALPQELVQPTADTLYKTEALPQQTKNVPQQPVDVPAPIQISTSAMVDTTPTVNNKKQYAAQLAAAFGEPPDMSELFPDELDSLIRSVFEQA